MADTKNIVITLKSVNGSNDGETPTTEPKDTTTGTKVSAVAGVNSKANSSDESRSFEQLAFNMGNNILTETMGLVDYFISRQFDLVDDYIGERNYSIASSIINKVQSVGTTAVSFGLMFGPFGAAIGAMYSVGKNALDIAMSYDRQNIAIQKQENQLSYTRARAGWSTNAGSIGEDL